VSVINMATNTRVDVDPGTPGIQDITVGTNPTSVVVSTDSRRVYVANEGSNSVSVIDTATNKVVGTINFGSAPVALALARETADLFNLFVVNQGSNNVSVVHVADTSDLIEVAGGSTVTVNNSAGTPALSFGDTTSSTTVNTAGTLLRIRDAGSSVTVQGPVLSGTNTTFNVDRGFLRLNNGGSLFAGPGSTALFGLSGSTPGATTVNTVTALFNIQDSNTALITAAPLFSADNTTFTLGPNLREASSFLNIEEGGLVISSGTAPFISLAGSNVTQSNNFFTLRRSPDNVAQAAAMFLTGTLADISNSSITTNRNFAQILENSTLVQSGSATTPLFNTANSIFNIGDPALGAASNDFFVVANNSGASTQGPATVILSGPLLADSGSTFSGLNRLVTVADGSTLGSTTPNALVQLSGSTVTTSSNVFTLSSGTDQVSPFMTLAGPLLSASNATFNMGSTFFFVGDSAIFNGPQKPLEGDAAPLMNFNHSSVTGANPLLTVRRSLTPETPTIFNLGGPLLNANNGSVFNLDSTLLNFNENGQLNGFGTTALVQSGPGNSFLLTGNFLTVTNASGSGTPGPGTPGPATVNLAGGLLSDTDSTFNIGSRFQNISGGSTVTSSSTTDAFTTFSGSTVSTANDFTQVTGSGSTLTLSNSLLSAGGTLNIGTDPAVSGDVLDINSGGQLIMNSANPVLVFNGGTHTVGTSDTTANNTNNHVVRIQGVTTNLNPTTGLGIDQPLIGNGTSPAPFTGAVKPVGTLIQGTGGATIQVNAGTSDVVNGTAGTSVHPGNAVQVDRALFEAALPIINLASTGSTQTSLTTAGGTLDMSQSKVVSNGPVIALDNSLIKVNNGPLITLRNGSTLDVAADLLTLTNGSKINVVNGPLILVTGNAPSGTSPSVSTLNVNGALANFGSTGGNTIVVNNTITPNAALAGGIPVAGSNISITNPIKNTGLGSILVNGVAVGSPSPTFTGSLIQTQSGGRVTISGH
jgi:YVTN family beta-propeller protein